MPEQGKIQCWGNGFTGEEGIVDWGGEEPTRERSSRNFKGKLKKKNKLNWKFRQGQTLWIINQFINWVLGKEGEDNEGSGRM